MDQSDSLETDEALALKAGRDDAVAFEELARRYQVPLLRFLCRFTTDRHEAEDLLQESFARLYVGRASYKARWPYRTWAFTVARRVAIDRHRRRVASPTVPFQDEPAVPSREPVQEGELWSLARRHLSADTVQALWMFHVEEIPPREIARVLGRSWVGVRALLSRGRRVLRSIVEMPGAPGVARVAWTRGGT